LLSLSVASDNGVSVSRGWFAGSSIEFVLQCGHKIEKTGERKKRVYIVWVNGYVSSQCVPTRAEGPFARRSLGTPSPIEPLASARLELEIETRSQDLSIANPCILQYSRTVLFFDVGIEGINNNTLILPRPRMPGRSTNEGTFRYEIRLAVV
jgi:hypothetical protein